MVQTIRLLVVDDHDLVRKGLISLLKTEPAFEIVGEAASVEEALTMLPAGRPDVALVDLAMPRVPGIEGIAQLLARQPSLGIVVVTASDDSSDVLNAIRAGAQGYVLKNADTDTLFDVIRRVHAGTSGLDKLVAPVVFELLRALPPDRSTGLVLTPREQEVAALLVAGADNAEIAQRLVISENTVKTHISHIFEKTGAKSRTDLLGWAAGPGRGTNKKAS